jgi:endoglucanase
MRSIVGLTIAVMAFSFGISNSKGQTVPTTQPYHEWWRDSYPRRSRPAADARALSLIRVVGNHFVDSDGKTILFRGVSIADPDKIEHEGHWNQDLFQHIKDMGATIVRIPIHPIAWRQRTATQYLPLLDQAVHWCDDLHIYIDIDWHSIGNLKMQLFQDPMYDTTEKETYEFWRTIARHFNGYTNPTFYELFNEPTSFRGQLGNISWEDWKKINENMIGLIRSFDRDKIELVAGFDWAYDLTPLREQPIAAEGIGYVTHPYANKRQPPWQPKWEEDFGFAADRYPIIATEIGFSIPQNGKVGDNDYGNLITRYLESRGISWIAWVYDPEWRPQLLQSWDYSLTGSGEFFKQAMQREITKPK